MIATIVLTEIGLFQRIFDTASLSAGQWLICLVVACRHHLGDGDRRSWSSGGGTRPRRPLRLDHRPPPPTAWLRSPPPVLLVSDHAGAGISPTHRDDHRWTDAATCGSSFCTGTPPGGWAMLDPSASPSYQHPTS